MRQIESLLVIGPRSVRDQVARLVQPARLVVAERALDGVWQAGSEQPDAVLISLALGRKARRVLRAVRALRPEARVVLVCEAVHEPDARGILEAGADDYVLLPLRAEDVQRALGLYAPPAAGAAVGAEFGAELLAELAESLRSMDEGAGPILERWAVLIAERLRATGVVIEIDEEVAEYGRPAELVIEQPIRRQEHVVGRIGLGPGRSGAYPASVAELLGRLAGLVEATATAARRLSHWRHLAWSDDLSRLHNRRYLELRLGEMIERASERRERITLLLLDLDDFKHYNDLYGHATGDELIREFGELLLRCTRRCDMVARFGGDEFAVVFYDGEPRVAGSQHPTEALEIIERFRAALREHSFTCLGEKAPGPLTISGGLAAFPWDGTTVEQLLRAADAALKDAKRVGKNRIQVAGGAANGAAHGAGEGSSGGAAAD